tara:strand:- start:625 stop:1140 length:516 start_codon:yes stop_codon:yes gene_type:complete
MAIIYTYPSGTPSASDNILGTQVDPITEENKTVQFGIQDVANLATNNYLETTVTVTSAQLLALNGADVTLIAAQGANTYIKIILVTSFLDFNTTQYTASQPLNISIGGNTAASIPTSQYNTNADRVYSAAVSSIALAANSAVFLTTDASPTNGNSSLKIKIRYQVLDTTAF